MFRRFSQAAMLLLASAGAAPSVPEIGIDNFVFSPSELTVAAGTSVRWINHDDIPHVIVSADRETPYRSHALDTGESFSWTFPRPGRYRYFCGLHPTMLGMIVVR